jgi:purine-binding chemotaxis protein CheW
MAATSAEVQFVAFRLGDETFAAPVTLVREILDYRPAFKIPNGPDHLLGLTDVRGVGVPTVDLRLGLTATTPPPHTRILVLDILLEDRTLSLGLVADQVVEVVSFRGDQIEAAPDIGSPWNSAYIAGVVRREGGFVVLMDLARLFSRGEAEWLSPSSRAERAA